MTCSDLARRTRDLGDNKDEHEFCNESEPNLCSWSGWLDLWMVQLKNVHGPIMKENV